MSTKEITVAWGYMREGDKFLRYDITENGTRVVIEREVPALPLQNGSIIRTTFGEYHRIDGEYVDINDGGPLAGDPIITDILTPRPAVSYGDIRDVLRDNAIMPDNPLVEALMNLFKGES